MPSFYEIRYDDGRIEETFGIRGLYYELPDRETLDVLTEIGWCFGCNVLTDIERLESIEEIDQQIADMQNPETGLYQYRSQIAETLRRRAFLLQRIAPAKCVHCGTDRVKHIPLGESVDDPLGRGTFAIEWVGMCSTDFMGFRL